LFLVLVIALFRLSSIYAVLGPEATPILRVLVGNQDDIRIVNLQPGGLTTTLAQTRVDALILPEDWADDSDLGTARAANVPIVTLKRHTSIANMIANIRLLGKLTRNEQAAKDWIERINKGLAHIRQSVACYPPTRVLVLTPEGYTPGQGALITELISIANGINVAAEAGIPEARQIGDDQIRELAPDVVLLIGWTPDSAAIFAGNTLYHGIPAFDRDHIYQIAPPGKDPASLVQDVQALADLMHPAEF
jgi:ABC-type Fe3+-hydroxamate transport system substrate-binding protein